jgi:rhodanese-related sulfurtransferase
MVAFAATALTLGGCSGAGDMAEAPAASEAASSHDPVEAPDATELDVAMLKQRLDAGEKVFLLDVRNPDELVEHGMIEGAVNIPIDQLGDRLSEVPSDVEIVTYCMSGGRASRAAALLRENGYDQPIEFGGITAWKEAGYPVVQP